MSARPFPVPGRPAVQDRAAIRRRRRLGAAALGVVAALTLAACALVAFGLPNAVEWMGRRAPTQTLLPPRGRIAALLGWRPAPGWALGAALLLAVGLALAAQPNKFIYFEF